MPARPNLSPIHHLIILLPPALSGHGIEDVRPNVAHFTKHSKRLRYIYCMAQKKDPPSFDPWRERHTDYFLIATGVGAAVVALIYLLLL